ncbi:MAG: ferric reductase-like transmembrane domain-containing protein [Gammaproteobacteria bacterium]
MLDFYFDQRYYAEMMYDSGVFSVQLLVITLSITPLMVIFRKYDRIMSVLRWFKSRRRYLGVSCFAYALIHLLVYLRRNPELSDILWHMQDLKIAAGWIGFTLLLALALTSNDKSARQLGPKWKSLHRWIYIGAALIFLHWALFGFFINQLLLWLIPIALLQTIRLHLHFKNA